MASRALRRAGLRARVWRRAGLQARHSSCERFGVLLVVALGGLAPSGGAARAQQAQLSPSQLQLFVSAVVDAAGTPITDLEPEEIAMTENGVAGKVISVERFPPPIKLTLTVDNGRESQAVLDAFRTGLTGLVEALPPDVEVTLVTTAPQPSFAVRPTTDRAVITRGIQRFTVDSDEAARFSDALVEYAGRLDGDAKEKKLTYSPVLVMVSTSAPENTNSQRDTIERALKTLATRGARVSLVTTTANPTNAEAVSNLKNGRQALIAAQIIKASGGRFEPVLAFRDVATLLPAWGKQIAASHLKSVNQFRIVIDRPGGATGQLNKPGLVLRRNGAELKAGLSLDGRLLE